MLSLKLIPILWIAVILCNLLANKAAPELSSWYPVYSIMIGVLTTAVLLLTAAL